MLHRDSFHASEVIRRTPKGNRPPHRSWLYLLAALTLAGFAPPATAQVVPDATLGNGNNSTTLINGIRTDINGGLQRGSALFHSFERFGILTNHQVYFANPAGIRNIFSRVTGGSISNIDGLLGVSGGANLFFMNPNGIIFGPNARLDVSGSFLATTANVLQFADGQKFAATGDRAVPLVEVNIPIGLQYGANPPAMLTNRGTLAVGAGQSLTLAGGNTTNTGSLTAPGGTVQVLGQQVALLDNSQIDVSSAIGGGTVLVGGDYQGKGSLLNAQSAIVGQDAVIKADALVNGNGGKVIVWADGDTRFNGTISAKGGVQGGNGGFVEVSGKQRLAFQGQVDTRAAQGKAGTLLLDPATITIANDGADLIPQATDPGDFVINPAALQAALDMGAIILQADTSIIVTDAINSGGNVNANNLTFTAPAIDLNASVTTNGAQIYAGAVTLGANATLTSNNGNVEFNNTVNSAANAANTASAANSLNIAAGTGNVSFNGAVGGGANGALGTLNASGAIALNNLTAAQAILTSASPIQLGTSNVTGNLNVTANGNITSNGNIIVDGITTLAAGGGDITLDQVGNNFNTVQVNSGRDVTLNDIDDLNLGTVTATTGDPMTGNTILVEAGGTLLLQNAITAADFGSITLQGNTVTANLGAAESITALAGTVNILGNTINLNTGLINVSGAGVKPSGGTVRVGGTFTDPVLTNATAINVDGAPPFTINGTALAGGNPGQVFLYTDTPNDANTLLGNNGIQVVGVPTDNIIFNPSINNLVVNNNFQFNNVTILNGAVVPSISPVPRQFTIDAFNNLVIAETYFEALSANPLYSNTGFRANNQFTINNLVGDNTLSLTGFPLLSAGNIFTMNNVANTIIKGAGSFEIAVGDINAPNNTASLTAGAITTTAAAGTVTLTSAGSLNANNALTTNGGNITAIAAGNLNPLNVNNAVTTAGGAIAFTSAGGLNVNSTLTTVGGDITLTTTGGNLNVNNVLNTTAIAPTKGGDIAITGSSNVTVAGGSNFTTGGGNVTVRSTGTLTSGNLVTPSTINTSLANSRGGDVTFIATNGDINLTNNQITSVNSGNNGFSQLWIEATNGSTNLINSTVSAANLPGATGFAGDILINASDTIDISGSTISTSGNTGRILVGSSDIAGKDQTPAIDPTPQTVTITSSSLTTDNAIIGGYQNSGDINVIAQNSVSIGGVSSRLAAETTGSGRAGNITIEAPQLISVKEGSTVSTSSTARSVNGAPGSAGNVSLTAIGGRVEVDRSNISNTVVDGTGENINVAARTVALQNGAKVNASTSGGGRAGEIIITATAPNPNPTTAALTIANSQVQASSSGQGLAGAVSLKVQNGDIAIRSSSSVSSGTSGSGDSGSVTISGQNLAITGGSVVRARSDGAGAPGSISVDIANTLAVSGTNASGQISEISTFSDTAANLSNPDAGNIRINQPGSPVRTLELSERGRINASTQSTDSTFTGGNIQVYADNLRISSGGQIVASSLDDGNSVTGQAGAGDISIVSNSVDISGSKQDFVSDPAFKNTVALKRIGSVNEDNGLLLNTSGGVPAASLASRLGLANLNNLTNPTNGSGIQLSILNDLPGTLSFNWTFLTNETTGNLASPFNDASFVTGNSAPVTSLANANTGNFVAPSPIPGFSSITTANPPVVRPIGQGNVVNVGVVNAGDTAVASGLQLINLKLNGQDAQVLVSSPDIDPTKPFISGIFARADGTGNAGSVAISGVGAAANVTLNNGAQISTSTDRGGQTTPSNITLTGLNTLTASNNSLISASTNSGQAGDVKIDVTQGLNPAVGLTGNSSIAATALSGGNAGSVTLNTPTLSITDGSSVAVSSIAGAGVAGEVNITASTVNLTNARISAETDAGGASSPANINLRGLNTLQLNNAQISAFTQTGQAGNLLVDAREIVNLNNDSLLSVQANGQNGNSGTVSLNTRQLTVNSSQISASTTSGVGGDITLQGLDTLQMNNGAVLASTQTGRAGSVAVNASGNIDLINGSRIAVEANGVNGVAGNVTVTSADLNLIGGAGRSAISTSATGENASAGNVTLNAIGRTITLQNSDVLASSLQGTSGNINITSRRLDLNNGTIKAEIGQNTANQSGSIKLDVSFRLTLENESEISTLGRNGANGGDISILNVRFLFGRRATGANGSDIVGRAEGGGRGGRVFLDRSTLVQGFLFRRAVDGNRTNDIDTNGQLDNFSTNADEGARGLSKPLIIFSDVTQITSSACEAVGAKSATNSELRIAGRGGVASSPTAPLSAQATASDWVSLELSPQVPLQVTLPDGKPMTLEPSHTYQLQATCVNVWKEQQRSLL